MSIKGNADTNVLRGKVTSIDVICIDAYAIAVKNGFEGTEEEWLASLKGDKGEKGDAYIITENDINEIAEKIKPEVTAEIEAINAVLDEIINTQAEYIGGDA